MRIRTMRNQWRLLAASLTATLVLPLVGSGVAYGLPPEPGRPPATGQVTEPAPQAVAGYGMRGYYTASGVPTKAITTATFRVPPFDAIDCGLPDESWSDRRVHRDTRIDSFYVQIWTHCSTGRLRAGGWWIVNDVGPIRFTELMSPGDRLTVTTEGSSTETRISVHNLDRGWVEEKTAPGAPNGRTTILANNTWDGDLPNVEHASFKGLRIDGRPFGEYAPKADKTECTRVSPLRDGTSFRVTHICPP